MTRNDTDDEARSRIVEAVRRHPWLTHREIADELDVSRSWVSEVVGSSDELQSIREAYKKGVELDASSSTLVRLADVVDLNPDGDREVAKRIRESASRGDVELVRIEFVPRDGDSHKSTND